MQKYAHSVKQAKDLKQSILHVKAATDFSASYPSQFCPSVCLTCPSVCLSHGWISQKRCKLRSPNLHRRLPGRF